MIRNTKIIIFFIEPVFAEVMLMIPHGNFLSRDSRCTAENENKKGKEKWTGENEKWLEGVPSEDPK